MRDIRRILIINPFGIGDVLFTTPLVRAIRRAFPQSRIGYLCNRRTERVLRDNPHLDELFIYEKDELVRLWRKAWWSGIRYVLGLVRRLGGGRFDLIIDLSLGERYSLLLRLLGVPRVVGFNYRRRGRFLTESLPIDGYHDRHVVDYYRRLLTFVGVRLIDDALELQPSSEDRQWALEWLHRHGLNRRRPLVGIVPAGGVSWGVDASFRRWSAEGFAKVGDALVEQHEACILLFGEASDAPACRTVAGLMKHPTVDVSGQTSLAQFTSLLGCLQLVICNDGGPLHLAVSQRVRTVSVFGPVDPVVYGPHPPSADHRVVCREELPCRPCYHRFKLPPCPYERACLTTVGSQEVIEACAALLKRASGAPAAVEALA